LNEDEGANCPEKGNKKTKRIYEKNVHLWASVIVKGDQIRTSIPYTICMNWRVLTFKFERLLKIPSLLKAPPSIATINAGN